MHYLALQSSSPHFGVDAYPISQIMPVTLFVDGIAKTVTSEQLERLFQSFHPSQVILASHRSGTPLVFAFVLFSDEEQAAQAFQHLQGTQLAGSRIVISRTISPVTTKIMER